MTSTGAAVVPPGRPPRLFPVEATSDRLKVLDQSGHIVAVTTTAAIAAVQAAAVANDDGGIAYVSDSADRCLEITRTPAGLQVAGACDTRWAGIVANVLNRHGHQNQ